ncbi:MAG: putative YigZ family protein [Planctomycetota bacterium]|jgi:uncharacterized YigZ family protein
MQDENIEKLPDTWVAALDGPETEHKAKGSRFLGQAFAARTVGEAKSILLRVKKLEHGATHHCSAYLLPPIDAPIERFDDDGEPSQTAGAPILQAIHATEMLGVIVVVTRYFGGTKLGTGGLIKAYGESAREALAATPRETIWLESVIELDASYEDVGCAESFLAQKTTEIRNVEREFADRARFLVTTARSRADMIMNGIREASAARIKTRIVGSSK